MRIRFLQLLIFLGLGSIQVCAQTIRGQIFSDIEPVPFALVFDSSTVFSTVADKDGFFDLNTNGKSITQLRVTAMGFKAKFINVPASEDKTINLGKIMLEEDVLGLEEVVVTANFKETFVKDSPIKIDVITSRFLTKQITPVNLIESVSLINGVSEVVACGVCYTNSVSINGLPGPYSAILIDGSPMNGNLASVYGLNGIPNALIEKIEVVKKNGGIFFIMHMYRSPNTCAT